MGKVLFIAVSLAFLLTGCMAINRFQMLHQHYLGLAVGGEAEDLQFMAATCKQFYPTNTTFNMTLFCETTFVPNMPEIPEDGDVPDELEAKLSEALILQRKLELCLYVAENMGDIFAVEACDAFELPHEQDDSKIKKIASAVARFGVEDELASFSIRALKTPSKTATTIDITSLGYLVYRDVIAESSGKVMDIPYLSLTVDGVCCTSPVQKKALLDYHSKVCKKDSYGATGIAELVTGPNNKEEFKLGMTKAKELLIHIAKEAKTCSGGKKYSNLNVMSLEAIIKSFNSNLREEDKGNFTMVTRKPEVGADYEFFVVCGKNVGASHNVQLNYGLNLALYDFSFFTDVMYDPFARDMMSKSSKYGLTVGNTVLAGDTTIRGLFTAMFFSSAIKAYLSVYQEKAKFTAASWKSAYDQMIKFNFPDIPRFMNSTRQKALKQWIDTKPVAATLVAKFIPKTYFLTVTGLYKVVSKDEKTKRTEKQIEVAKGALASLSVRESSAGKSYKKLKKSTKQVNDLPDDAYTIYQTFMGKMTDNLEILLHKTFSVTYPEQECKDRYPGVDADFPFGKKVHDPNYPDGVLNINSACDSEDRWLPVDSNDAKGQIFVVNEARFHTSSVQDFALRQEAIFNGLESAWPFGVKKLIGKICGNLNNNC